MSGSMSLADLISDLKAILTAENAKKFTAPGNADFTRHLEIAALDMGRVRRRTKAATFTVVAGQNNYAAPADMISYKQSLWGVNEQGTREPWESNHPGRLPAMHFDAGEIYLTPAPTQHQIGALGTTYQFLYFAGHTIGAMAAGTSVVPADRHLLLIRATAQAMLELTNKGLASSTQLAKGHGVSVSRKSTPTGLYELLMDQFEAMA